MANNKPYIFYSHTDTEITTVGDFIDNLGLSIAKEMSSLEVLQYTVDGLSNFERIISQYNQEEAESNKDIIDKYNSTASTQRVSVDYMSLLLKSNTTLVLPKDRLFLEAVEVLGVNQVSEISTKAFIAGQLKRLLTDSEYKTVVKSNKASVGNVKDIHPHLTVWLWCRGIGQDQNTGNLTGQFLDISPFIQSITTSSDMNGGNFEIVLTPLIAERSGLGDWIIKRNSIQNYYTNNLKNSFVAQSGLHKLNAHQELQRNQFLFHTLINTNDLIFIRFETLQKELNDRSAEQDKFFVDKKDLPNKIYDMIGLIDSNTLTIQPENNEVGIKITGRDLTKTIIEDGSYFYPLAYAQGAFFNTKDDHLIQRLATTGSYILQSEYAFRSISFTLQLLMNHVSNLGIVPDDLFESYGDSRRSKVYRLDTERKQVEKILDIKKKSIFSSIARSRKADNISPTTIVSVGESVFRIILDFITSADNAGVLDGETSLWGPFTYQSESLFEGQITRVLNDKLFKLLLSSSEDLPFEEGTPITYSTINTHAVKAIKGAIDYYLLTKTRPEHEEPFVEKFTNGIWQIIKLNVDPDVADRRLSDPTVAQPDGSLINQFWKICQSPWVEFFTDTYGDQFYFLVRTPPFTKDAIHNFIYNDTATIDPNEQGSGLSGTMPDTGTEIRTADTVTITGSRNPAIMEIEEDDVISEDLQFNDKDVYTWYELIPKAAFAGGGNAVSLAYFPIIHFPQYTNVWGSRRLAQESNYLTYSGITGKTSQPNTNYLIEQAAKDMKFLIDIHAYLPFTRKGTIVINGDRRIKKGIFIRHKGTKEIFYVVGVSHTLSISANTIDRITILQVERGMVENFLGGTYLQLPGSSQPIEVSYFNIIDTEIIKKFIIANLTGKKAEEEKIGVQISKTFGVNEPVFNFFMRRQQFMDSYDLIKP